MKHTINLIAMALLAIGAYSCASFDDVKDIKEVEPVTVTIKASSLVEAVPSVAGMTITMDNNAEDFHYSATLTGPTMVVEGILPGIYTINIGGRALGDDGQIYKMNDSKISYAILADSVSTFTLRGVTESPLLFKEVFYANCKNASGGNYLFAQFCEIYNNSEFTINLDGLYFCDLSPGAATSSSYATKYSPERDLTQYAYGIRIWQVPGAGENYPLAPGESFVIVQRAQLHTTLNPVKDYSHAEFEFWMPSAGAATNFPAPNMTHIYLNNSASPGTLQQYLLPVAGPAIAIFRVPPGETFDPLNMDNQIGQLNTSEVITSYVAKIPISWVLDAVECGGNAQLANYKRVPGVLDSGMAWVELEEDDPAIYNNLSIARKVAEETGPNGELRLIDDNNSTTDFETKRDPQFRRYGVGKPSWSTW